MEILLNYELLRRLGTISFERWAKVMYDFPLKNKQGKEEQGRWMKSLARGSWIVEGSAGDRVCEKKK